MLLDPRPPKASAAAKGDRRHPFATSAFTPVAAPPAEAAAPPAEAAAKGDRRHPVAMSAFATVVAPPAEAAAPPAAAKGDRRHPVATSAFATVAAPPAAAGAERVADCRNNDSSRRSPTGKCAVDGVEFACVLLPPGLDSPDPRPPMKGAAWTTSPAADVCRARENRVDERYRASQAGVGWVSRRLLRATR